MLGRKIGHIIKELIYVNCSVFHDRTGIMPLPFKGERNSMKLDESEKGFLKELIPRA